MAEEGIFCTNADVLKKATIFATSAGSDEAFTNAFITQAESYINVLTRKNWSDIFTAKNIDVKNILKEAASNLAAIYVINYDTSLFPSRTMYRDTINTLWARFQQCITLLSDPKAVIFMEGA